MFPNLIERPCHFLPKKKRYRKMSGTEEQVSVTAYLLGTGLLALVPSGTRAACVYYIHPAIQHHSLRLQGAGPCSHAEAEGRPNRHGGATCGCFSSAAATRYESLGLSLSLCVFVKFVYIDWQFCMPIFLNSSFS